jgi:hypothetical protein
MNRMVADSKQYDLCGQVIDAAMKVPDGQVVGVFAADLLVNDSLMLELKANQLVAKAHEVQLVNYLVATGIDEGLLLNFGAERLEYKRKFRLPKQEQVSL